MEKAKNPGSEKVGFILTIFGRPKVELSAKECGEQQNTSVPDEITSVPGIDGNFHTSHFSDDRESVIRTCLGNRHNLSKIWPTRFGNAPGFQLMMAFNLFGSC